MWQASLPYEVPEQKIRIVPTKTLYYFDGPQVFVAKFGLLNALFVKCEDAEDNEVWAAAPVDTEAVALIEKNAISVRSAFSSGFCWIIHTRGDLRVEHYWIVPSKEMPDYMLPDRNAALSGTPAFVPDNLKEVDAFFAMRFQGENLKKEGMNFSVFKGLVDTSYDAARRILSPIVLLGSKSATFDFYVRQPEFSSLAIVIEAPMVNLTNVRRRAKDPDIGLADMDDQFFERRRVFFEELTDIINTAEKGRIEQGFAQEKFYILDTIQHVIPSEENRLSSVIFAASSGLQQTSLYVSEKVGLVMHRAFKEAERNSITDTGQIQIINSRSHSFVLMSARGRQVTCYVPTEWFRALERDERFRNRCRISVSGRLKRRQRRDELAVDAMPTIDP